MSEEKTEKPTPKKLREARQKGQVGFSKDTEGAVLFLAGVLMIFGLFASLTKVFIHSYQELVDLTRTDRLTEPILLAALERTLERSFQVPLGLLIVLFVTSLVIGVVQTRFNLSAEPLIPKLEKVNPLERLKQWFSMQNLFEFGKTLLKLVIVLAIAYVVFRVSLGTVLRLPFADLPVFSQVTISMVRRFLVVTTIVFLVVAVLDFLFQRWNHERQLKMSKDEVKREYKEQEGDPHIKSHRRSLHMEMAMSDVRQAVKRADVVLANPTHFAVAIRYRRDAMSAPTVVAKGMDGAAQRIKRFARRAGTPIVENKELARALHKVPVSDEIPKELYAAVAEVLAFVYRLEQQRRRSTLARWLRPERNRQPSQNPTSRSLV